jgi:hypothetical protein
MRRRFWSFSWQSRGTPKQPSRLGSCLCIESRFSSVIQWATTGQGCRGAFAKPFLPRKSHKYSISCVYVCVCSLSYPAFNAHATCYIVIGNLSGCIMFFSHYLKNGIIFGENSLNTKYLSFCFKFCPKHFFFILRAIERDIWSKMSDRLQVKYPLLLSVFNETWIF